MKKFIATLVLLPVVLILVLGIGGYIAVKQGVASRSDLEFLADLAQREGIMAAYTTVKIHLYGVDPSNTGSADYDRTLIAGRGHAPWVIRGNLDGRSRVLKFALAPQLWAAYDVEKQSLYQLWRGDVIFAGAAYDYRHGPQPSSEGEWFLRDTDGAQWFLSVDGEELPATVSYLGHEYGDANKTAAMRFALTASGHRAELLEQPDIVERDEQRFFVRTFTHVGSAKDITPGFHTADGTRYLATGAVEYPLTDTTPIPAHAGPSRGRDAGANELAHGESIIANSDCLGCHGVNHRIAGPAWSQIAGKFRGKVQDEVVSALASKIIKGGSGIWGTIPMPAHPAMSSEDASAAAAFILSTPELTSDFEPLLDDEGNPYPVTRRFDVLPRLQSLHPSFTVENIAPGGFEPKVGGMAFRDDGKLLVATWDTDGAVYLIDPDAVEEKRVKRIAEGLQEPLGLTLVDDHIFVLQKQELTELIDRDNDGIIDQYRAFSYDWPSGSNFHSFAFGLVHREDAFYFLLSICVLPGGASCPEQLPTQGKLLEVGMDGKATVYAAGFRTPNGIVLAPDNQLYVTDNQGDWLPSSKLVKVLRNDFYGSRAVPEPGIMERVEEPPAIWLPQDEIGNSPTEPLFLEEGPYAGQMIFGDVYNGGIKRVFLENIESDKSGSDNSTERPQGAVFHFTAGLRAPVNRLQRGPDGAIYIGEVGNPPNWGEYDKPWYGLERMRWVGNNAFEMLAVRARHNGFDIELTQPLATELSPDDLLVKQWFYHPNEQYGGPKIDETVITPTSLTLSPDRRIIHATLPGLEAGYVVYLRLHERLRAQNGDALWTAEAWYTLNTLPGNTADAIPIKTAPTLSDKFGNATPTKTETVDALNRSGKGAAAQGPVDADTSIGEWRDLFDGQTLSGWRNYGGDENQVEKWGVTDGTLALQQKGAFPMWDMISSAIFGGGSGDLIYYREKFRNFELSLEWKISTNGNSGIFYLVKDENENNPWVTGIEMQVLDNDGHSDGKIVTHRAGDLYDLISANPETVRPPGEWNEVRIRIKENHIEHWLNGVKVVSVERGGKEWNALVAASKFVDMPEFGKSDEGYIVLQDHGDSVWYRNIRVRSL